MSEMVNEFQTATQCHCTDKMADALKALGHPVRLRLVQEIRELKSCCCGDLCDCFSQSQSTISQHLSVLREAGIIDFEKNGNKSCFSLNYEVLNELQSSIQDLISLPTEKAGNKA
jgi:DNA-binding transcriptional ArsR family regulator